jgi:hypothetical protein
LPSRAIELRDGETLRPYPRLKPSTAKPKQPRLTVYPCGVLNLLKGGVKLALSLPVKIK